MASADSHSGGDEVRRQRSGSIFSNGGGKQIHSNHLIDPAEHLLLLSLSLGDSYVINTMMNDSIHNTKRAGHLDATAYNILAAPAWVPFAER